MTYFLLGYIVLSKENVLIKLRSKKSLLSFFTLTLYIISILIYNRVLWHDTYSLTTQVAYAYLHLTSWITILTLLGLGQSYMDFSNKFSNYMAKYSFQIYYVHQTVLVVLGYYIIPLIPNTLFAILIIIPIGFLSSVLLSEILKRTPILSNLFGMKK